MYTMQDLAAVATEVTKRFVDRKPLPAIARKDYVEVHYANAMCGDEVGNPFFRNITTSEELETLFNTKITLQETLMLTEF